MNGVLRVLGVLGVLGVQAAAQGLPQRDTRPAAATAGSGSLVGVVMTDEPQPRPLRRARVTVAGGGLPISRVVISGDDGAFTVDRLPAGSYTLTAAREGFVTMAYGATKPGRPGTPVTLAAQQSLRLDLRVPRGGVITGTVTDIDGQPAHGLTVTALVHRFVASTGERRYVPSAASPGLTDDRGVYRIYGLPAGEYVISAQPTRTQVTLASGGARMMSAGVPSDARFQLARVFHPSVTEVGRAPRIAVRAGEERAGVDVQLQHVPLATVSGTVSLTPESATAAVFLARADDAPGFEEGRNARTDREGRFAFPSVPPGHYRMLVRGITPPPGSPAVAHFAQADLTVSGEDITNLAVTLQPGLTIAGQVVFEADPPAVNLPVSFRSSIPAVMAIGTAGFGLPEVQLEGNRFTISGIVPGNYRMLPAMRGLASPIGKWWLKSLVVDGRDILDAPLDLRQGTTTAVATFTDRVSGVAGAVTDAQGLPRDGVHVVVVPLDRAAWFYGSRRIAAARTREGRYSVSNLPPGDYRVAAATDIEMNEWFDPEVLERLLQIGTPIKIGPAERVTVDLAVR